MENTNPIQSGSLKVSEDVISTIAGLAVTETEGVAGLVNPSTAIEKFFLKQRNASPIKIKSGNDAVELSLTIEVKPGYKVTSLAEAIQQRIKSDVQSMTGIMVSKVNVHVAGIVFDNNKK